MSKAVNSKWKKTFPDTIGNQNRPANGVDDTQPFETGGFPQYIANDPVRYDLQNAAMSQSMSNDARLKEMIDARGKELDDHKVDPGAHKTGIAGNAATATKATNDGNGDNIANTYLKKATVIDVIYPVGSIYMSMSATNPADLFGVGTWKRISQGRMLLGADDSTYKAGATGGEAAHTLSVNEMPEHSHTGTTSTNGEHSHSASWLYAWGGSDTWNYFAKSYSDNPGKASGGSFTIGNAGNHNHTFTTNNTGGGAAHNNMPPYLVCYIWQRTA